MTATLDTMAKNEPTEEPAELAAARELVRQAKKQGLSLTGPDGLLKQLTKTVPEAALDEELTDHLGHERRGSAVSGNVPNGTRSKTVLTEASGHVGSVAVVQCKGPLHAAEPSSLGATKNCAAGSLADGDWADRRRAMGAP